MDKYEQVDNILDKYGLTEDTELNRKKVKVWFNGRTAVMTKQIQTFFDHVNTCNDSTTLLKHIAKMMAIKNQEYTDAFVAEELRDALAMDMVKYDNEHTGKNYEVTCTYCGVTESSTFRARKLGMSLVDMFVDEMSLDDYVKQVVDPVSKELAARIISKIEGPLSATECDIKVGLA